jgi:hypothetical protein
MQLGALRADIRLPSTYTFVQWKRFDTHGLIMRECSINQKRELRG